MQFGAEFEAISFLLLSIKTDLLSSYLIDIMLMYYLWCRFVCDRTEKNNSRDCLIKYTAHWKKIIQSPIRFRFAKNLCKTLNRRKLPLHKTKTKNCAYAYFTVTMNRCMNNGPFTLRLSSTFPRLLLIVSNRCSMCVLYEHVLFVLSPLFEDNLIKWRVGHGAVSPR